jgi:hypothetical protein
MKFTAKLLQKSDALYHGTSMSGIVGILRDNAINEGVHWGRNNEPHGVRLTRSKQVAMSFAVEGLGGDEGAVIEFDPAKLAKDFKLQDYEDVDSRGDKWQQPEEEVVVLTPKITNVKRYITGIYLKPFSTSEAVNDYAQLVEEEERMSAGDWKHGYQRLLKNPLVKKGAHA